MVWRTADECAGVRGLVVAIGLVGFNVRWTHIGVGGDLLLCYMVRRIDVLLSLARGVRNGNVKEGKDENRLSCSTEKPKESRGLLPRNPIRSWYEYSCRHYRQVKH